MGIGGDDMEITGGGQMSPKVKKSYHFIRQAGIGFAAAAQATEGVKHARTEETDEGDHTQLDAGRSIPARGELADGARFIHPSSGPGDGFSRGFDWRLAIIHRKL